jgi:hypothetical protein
MSNNSDYFTAIGAIGRFSYPLPHGVDTRRRYLVLPQVSERNEPSVFGNTISHAIKSARDSSYRDERRAYNHSANPYFNQEEMTK